MAWLPARAQRQPPGKLKAAARAIFDAPPPPSPDELRNAAEWGLPLEALYGAAEVQPLDVWPENWPALQLFALAGTQWLRDAAGQRCGINYTALTRVEQLLRLRGRPAREAFAGLQVLEREWLRLERSERAAAAALR